MSSSCSVHCWILSRLLTKSGFQDGALDAAIGGLGHAAHRLGPAEGLLDLLAAPLRQSVAFLAGGPATDYMMPRLDGLTLIPRLRTLGSQVPIILTTSVPESQLSSIYSGGHNPTRGGHNRYIGKPYVIEQILDAIERLLGSRPS